MLKNLMEDKQLNFDQPLLSVRRGSSTAPLLDDGKKKPASTISSVPRLPYYKSELKSGPVRNPGAVPFQWEQIPGRPKDERKPEELDFYHPRLAPKLPPGRIPTQIQKPTDKVQKDLSDIKLQMENNIPGSPDMSSLDKNATELEKGEEDAEEENKSSAVDNDSNYADALDTLSRSESFFLNCSVTGVSGLDSSEIKPYETFSDKQSRDFMMDRFLPAAKAVASEMPHFGSRKQPSVKVFNRPVKKLVTWDLQPPIRYPAQSTPVKSTQAEEDDEEEEEVDYDETEILSAKLCGLFPRFCLLNPIPGMRDQVRIPVSSVRRVNKKPASAGSFSNSEKLDNRTAFARRPTTPVHKSLGENKTSNGVMNQITRLHESWKSDGLRRHGHAKFSAAPPYRNALPTSIFHEERGFLGIPERAKFPRVRKISSHEKGYEKFQVLLADQKAKVDSYNADSTIEKTLYVDSVETIESQHSNSSFSSESRGTTDSRRTPSVDYALLSSPDEKASSGYRDFDYVDCKEVSSLEESTQKIEKDGIKEFQQIQDLNLDSGTLKSQGHHQHDMNVQQPAVVDAKESAHDSHPSILLPPPLPKSPSESWLSRTLPSMPSKPSSRSHVGVLRQGNLAAARPSPGDLKWETVVKSSNSPQGPCMLTAELAPISEN